MKQYKYKISVWDLIGLSIAVCFFFLGCSFGAPATHDATFRWASADSVRSVMFGADFYTEIHAAVRIVNDNLTVLNNNLETLLDTLGDVTQSLQNQLQSVHNLIGTLVMAVSAFAAVKFGKKMIVKEAVASDSESLLADPSQPPKTDTPGSARNDVSADDANSASEAQREERQ